MNRQLEQVVDAFKKQGWMAIVESDGYIQHLSLWRQGMDEPEKFALFGTDHSDKRFLNLMHPGSFATWCLKMLTQDGADWNIGTHEGKFTLVHSKLTEYGRYREGNPDNLACEKGLEETCVVGYLTYLEKHPPVAQSV